MKLTLIILLLTGVVSSAQNLRGDENRMMLNSGGRDLAVRKLKTCTVNADCGGGGKSCINGKCKSAKSEKSECQPRL